MRSILVFVLLYINGIHAIPFAGNPNPPLTPSDDITTEQILSPAPAQSPLPPGLSSNTTTTPNVLLPRAPSRPECYPLIPGRNTPTITGCKPTLDKLKLIPEWKRPLLFKMDKWPKPPLNPPIYVHARGSNCDVIITCPDCNVEGYFSFEQVRRVAYDVVETCQDVEHSAGGKGRLGDGRGWVVEVMGPMRVPLVRHVGEFGLGNAVD